MKLYDYFRSSAAYRVRIALNLKGQKPERSFVHLRKNAQRGNDYLKLNPQGLVPALVTDGGDVISQSLAIIAYLDETFPKPPLMPATPAERARVRSIALEIACDIHPLNNLRVLQYLQHNIRQDKLAVETWYRHWVSAGFTTLETLLPDSPFAGGEAPNIVDAFLVPQMYNARRFAVDLQPFPRLTAMADRALALPAFAQAAPPPL